MYASSSRRDAIGTCAGVLVVALLASVVPALRALRVGPMVALRAE